MPLYQHKTEPLTYTIWGDNNFVKTFSNFHSPNIIAGGLKRKHCNPGTKQSDLHQSPVSCPKQVQAYCNTFHLIDKGNGAEAVMLMGGPQKLAVCLFNMHRHNVYRIYCCMVEDYSETLQLNY